MPRHCKPSLIFLSPTKKKKKKSFIILPFRSGEFNCILKFFFSLDSGKLESIQEKLLKVVSRLGNHVTQGTVNYRTCFAFAIFKGSVPLTGAWESQVSGIL